MKNGRGRKKDSGVFSGIKPQHETWQDICNRIIYGSAEWRIVRLRQLIGDGSKLADNHLSARAAERDAKVGEICYELRNKIEAIRREHLTENDQAVLRRLRSRDTVRKLTKHEKDALRNEDAARRAELKAKADANERMRSLPANEEIDALWNTWSAQCERAVLDGEPEWFASQAKAIEKGGSPQRAQFNAKVVHLFETAFFGTWAKQRVEQEKNEDAREEAQTKEKSEWERYLDSAEGRAANQQQRQRKFAALVQRRKVKPHIESATLTPAGKFTDAMAVDIYNALEKQSALPLVVEGVQFKSKERAMDAIRDLAEQLQFELKKQPRRKKSNYETKKNKIGYSGE